MTRCAYIDFKLSYEKFKICIVFIFIFTFPKCNLQRTKKKVDDISDWCVKRVPIALCIPKGSQMAKSLDMHRKKEKKAF